MNRIIGQPGADNIWIRATVRGAAKGCGRESLGRTRPANAPRCPGTDRSGCRGG